MQSTSDLNHDNVKYINGNQIWDRPMAFKPKFSLCYHELKASFRLFDKKSIKQFGPTMPKSPL